jgi:8-oxo-dGTP diphosphatase
MPHRRRRHRRAALADLAYRVLYRAGYGLARQWWRLRRPRHEGALVAVWAPGDRLLLVRVSYRAGWSLPGGSVRTGEAPSAAAARELAEELGLEADADRLVPAIEVTGAWEHRRDRVHVFELRLAHEPPLRPDRREVVRARFVSRAALARLRLSPPPAAYAASLPQATTSRPRAESRRRAAR